MKATIGSHITLPYSEDIATALTFPNPAYANAMRYSGYDKVKIPENVYYYYHDELTGEFIIPRNFPLQNVEYVKDLRVKVKVDYPLFTLPLRPIQKKAREAYLNNDGDGIIVQQTGTGKTQLCINIAYKLRQKALIIVWKDDLVVGWRKDIIQSLGLRPKQIGLIKAKTFRIGEQLTITTIQTLSKLPRETLLQLGNIFGMVICDESHRLGGNSYKVIHDYFNAYYRLGVTATDMRNDGLRKVLELYFGKVVFRGEDKDAEDAIVPPDKVIIKKFDSKVHFSAPPRFKVIPAHCKEVFEWENDLCSFKIGYGFELLGIWIKKPGSTQGQCVSEGRIFNAIVAELENAGIIKRMTVEYDKAMKTMIRDKDFTDIIVEHVYSEFKQRKSCVVFCHQKEQIDALRVSLERVGIREEVQCYYGDGKDKYDVIRTRAEDGSKLITLTTYAIATEGTNVKRWERLFMASPVANEKDLIQAIGRGRRTCAGKDNLVVYDYRHPYIDGMSQQGWKRDMWYKKLHFKHSVCLFGTKLK